MSRLKRVLILLLVAIMTFSIVGIEKVSFAETISANENETIIEFKDNKNLYEALIKYFQSQNIKFINNNENKTITMNVNGVSKLELSSNNINDITQLAVFENLQVLYLGNNQISDITPLSGLTELWFLSLSGNQIEDISALSGLIKLNQLYIDMNKIKDISAMNNMEYLYDTNIYNNQISDISPLANLTNLKGLSAHNNQIEDISPLENLTGLERLMLSGNKITDISALSSLINLEQLIIYDNQIENINAISKLKKLTSLNLRENKIKDISPLSNLTNLQSLDISHNQIEDITPISNLTNLTALNTDGNLIPIKKYQITAKASKNGVISPSGTTEVEEGQYLFYEIKADKGFVIKDVLVDGNSIGKKDMYVFTDIVRNHTIEAKFEEIELYTINAKKTINGTITPVGVAEIEEGEDKTYKIKADAGYEIEDVLVDGKSVGKVSSYKFKDIDEDHIIEAKFIKIEENKMQFEDVKANDWFNDSVEYVTQKGLMNGVGDNKFSPNSNTTRGMIVTVLYRLAEAEENKYSTFADVSKDAYYSKPIAWASKKGIVNGVGDNKFAPDSEITREQFVTILYRYSEIIEKEEMSNIKNNLTNFNDMNKINSYAMDGFKWAVKEEIITGRTKTELAPQGTAKRAEVATMLMRFMERNNKTTNEDDYDEILSAVVLSAFKSEMGFLEDMVKSTMLTAKGTEAIRGNFRTDAQLYNYIARGGEKVLTSDEEGNKKWLTQTDAKAIPCTEINTTYAKDVFGMELPNRKVNTYKEEKEQVSYFVTPMGEVFCWPPFEHEGKSYVSSDTTVTDKNGNELSDGQATKTKQVTIYFEDTDETVIVSNESNVKPTIYLYNTENENNIGVWYSNTGNIKGIDFNSYEIIP